MERKFVGKSRGRKLTAEEAAKYKALRQAIEKDKPAIQKEAREMVAELQELAGVFAELRRMREAQGLSLADIAERTGIDRSSLSKFENGLRQNFTLDTVLRYARAVGQKVSLVLSRA